MPNAVFVAPFLLPATTRFIAAAAQLPGVRLGLVSQDPEERLSDELRESLAGHYRIADGTDAQQIADATRALARHLGGVDRVIGMLEQLQVPLGEVRDALGVPGMGAEVAHNFRDKARMKTVFEEHGVPCARHRLAESAGEARSAAADLGYPLVAKPPAGAGARSTFRIDGDHQLEAWLHADPPHENAPVLLEQMVVGAEHSFDSVLIDGEPVWHSISRYLPTPLEVLENPWIQWAVLLPRDIDTPEYDAIRSQGVRGLRALGLNTGLTHMEWFRRPSGDIAISEVAARPPGAQFTSLLSYAHDGGTRSARHIFAGRAAAPCAPSTASTRCSRSSAIWSSRRPCRAPDSRRPARMKVRDTSSSAILKRRLSKQGCAESSKWRASNWKTSRDRDGADDLARLSGRDAVLRAWSCARRRAGHRRG
jgi:D-alanine-D-alanine ligase-like ATP-grasp enzyme